MENHKIPGPNAELIGHAVVGYAGGRILHDIARAKTSFGAIIAWLIGAGALIWAHVEFDMPVARLIASIAPEIG